MRGAPPFAPVGQEGALATLLRLWATGEGPRTLLFAGPDSVGRRPAARWLCAYLNCLRGSPGERPCGRCESCRLLALGTHPDLKEVVPAATTDSGRAKRSLEIRIDQLVPRERGDPEPLGPWLAARPRYAFRVGVIDHADAMNLPAANSFLKVLEEPPPWAVIVLVAPGQDALLPTVASRCVTVRFGAVDVVAEQERGELPALHPGLAGHPGVRLGQPGAVLAAAANTEAEARAKASAEAFLTALRGDLLDALAGAEAFAQALAAPAEGAAAPLTWVRELIRERGSLQYAAAAEALDACEEALEAYAHAGLACAVLALELRRMG